MSAPRRVPAIRTDLEHVVIDGETVVYDAGSSTIHVLNATATDIWQRCDGSVLLAELVTRLAEAYATDVAVVERDVAACLEDFAQRGFLVGRGTGSGSRGRS